MKLLVFDPLDEHGHDNFNSFFIKKLNRSDVLFCISRRAKKKHEVQDGKNLSFPEFLFSKSRFKFLYLAKQFLLMLMVAVRSRKLGIDGVLILSYHNIPFLIVSYVYTFLFKGVFAFEHNNIPDSCASFVKRSIYLASSKRVLRLCLELYIKEHLESSLLMSSAFVGHPMREVFVNEEVESPKERIVFAPSSNVSVGCLESFYKKYILGSDYFLLSKKKVSDAGSNWIAKEKFENYDALLNRADYVYLPLNFEFRTSGVLYESLSLGKIILAEKCRLTEELSKIYPNIVVLNDDELPVGERERESFSVHVYNNNVFDRLKCLIGF